MSDQDTLNIEIVGNKYTSLIRRPDGCIDLLVVELGTECRNVLAKYTIGKDRRDMIARFFSTGGK